jgi:hypothetical protein
MVDRFQIQLALCRQCVQPRFISASWRLQNCAVFHIFPSATSHLSSHRLLGPHDTSCWVGGSGRSTATAGTFSHFLFLFFLLTSSFAAKSAHSTLLADGHSHPLPRGPTRPTTDHDILYPHPHMPHHRALACCTNHVTVLLGFVTPCAMSALFLAAARTTLPYPSWLHAPRHRACAGLPSTCTFSFFFFLLTPSFVAQSPHSHYHPCQQMGSRPPPPAPTTAQPLTAMSTTMAMSGQ